ncbi:MAG: hypothetical protein AB7L66_00110 [Gemmatimonadales bacterium]
MPATIKARLGDVVDVKIPLRWKKAEVDRLPDRERWTHYVVFADLGNPNEDIALAADSHNNGFPLASPGFPADVPLNPSDKVLKAYQPAAVKDDDQEVTATLWLNPELRAGGGVVFKAGRTVQVNFVYVGNDLSKETGKAKGRFHEVAKVEIISAEAAVASADDDDSAGAPWARGPGGSSSSTA